MFRKRINFLVIFLLIPIFLFGNFYDSILIAKADANKTIVVTFASTPSSATASVTPLKYNKDFAYSYFFDDGLGSAYDFAFNYLNGGYSTGLDQYFGGLYFTDGAGNNVPFRAGHSFYSRTSKGTATSTPPAYGDLHTSLSPVAYNIGWTYLQETVDYGWDIFNHGWTSASEDYAGQLFYQNWPAHGTSTLDYAYELSQEEAEVASRIFLKNNAGATTTAFSHLGTILPNGDAAYFQPALDGGTKIMYSTSNNNIPAISSHYANLNSTISLNPAIFPGRLFNYDSAFDSGGLFDYVDALAAQSVGSNKLFASAFTHQLTTSTNLSGGMSWTRWKSMMDHIETTYGRFGTDNVWVAGGQEVYEYQAVKQNAVVSSNLVGNQLTIEIDTTNVPTNLRRYALSLLVSSDATISSISYGAGFTAHTENKTTGLINVEWGENTYSKNDVTRVNELTVAAETTRLQVDIDKANIYLNMLQDATVRNSLQTRLQNIDVAGNKWLIQFHPYNSNNNTKTFAGYSENWNSYYSRSTTTFNNLKDSRGNVTSLAISVPVALSTFFQDATTTSGIYPTEILSMGMLLNSTTVRSIRLSNLNQSNKYKISVFGAHFRPGYTYKDTTYTINGVSKTLSVTNNTSTLAVFDSVIPDSNGYIDVDIAMAATGGTYNYSHINAIQVEEQFNKKPSITVNSSSQTSSGKATINYLISDTESDAGTLSSYQYSTTGSWSGEQATATPLVSDPSHDGVASLSSSAGGTSHNFVWDAAADLPTNFHGNVYFRLTPSDALAGEGFTGVSNSFEVDLRILSSSNVSAISSQASTTISWLTNKSASTQVEYGLGSWYGYSSTKKDNISRVTSHSENIITPACSILYYRTISEDEFSQQATSTSQSVSTPGCLGDSNISSSSSTLIANSSGGQASLTATNGQVVNLSASSSYAGVDTTIQIKELATSSVLAVAPNASSTKLLGGIYSLSSFSSFNSQVSNFNNNLSLSFSYSDADVLGVVNSSLKIKYWNATSSIWQDLNNCVIDQTAKTVTCQTNHFSEFALFGEEASVPGVMADLVNISSEGEIGLAWQAPADTGGSPIIDYQIEYRVTGSSTWQIWSTHPTTSPWYSTLFTPGFSYDFRVKARNAVGLGAASNPITIALEGEPVWLSGISKSYYSISISWGTNSYSSTQIEYGLTTAYGSSTSEIDLDPKVLSHSQTISGLLPCTVYNFRLLGTDNFGNRIVSANESEVTTGCTTPDAPTNAMATPGNGQASVAFSAPMTNGSSPITGYTVVSSPDNFTASGSSSPIIVTGLSNGTSYTFRVAAINSVGTGAFSVQSSAVIPSTTPSAPTNVTAARGNAQATISFLAPANNGGSAITSYTAVSSPGGFSVSASSSPITITGLTNGTSYTFTVKATNGLGDSVFSSPSSAVTPATIPGAPMNLIATPGNTQAGLAWETPSSNGGASISNYQIEYKQSSSGSWNVFSLVSSASSTATVTGLTNSISYDFRVIAINAIGAGPASNVVADVHLSSAPSAPLDLNVTRGNGQASLSWTEPSSNGGLEITNYYLEHKISSSSDWSSLLSGNSTSAIIGSLTNGFSYDFRVSAVNAAGTSSPSAIVSITPGNIPSSPSNVSAVRGDGQATISFDASANNGGSVITSYTVISSPGSLSASASSSPITITGLSNGTSYTFTVFATNDLGNSAASQASPAVTPATTPTAPTNLTVQVDNSTFNLSWSAPSSNGGAAVSSYQVEYHVQFAYPFDPYVWLSLNTTTSTSLAVNGLTSGVSYAFRVKAVNAVGAGATSNSATATLGGSVFSGISLTSSSTSAQINWNTGSISSTEVNYGITENYGSSSPIKDFDSMVLSHSETLQNLLPCTIYHYQLSAYDSLGNNSVSSDNTFQTTGCFGSSVPSANINFPVSVSSGATNSFDWSAGRSTSLSFPAGSASNDFQAQVFRLSSSSALITHPAPSNYLILGDAFQLNTYQNNGILSSFSQPANLKLYYQDGELNNLNELTIAGFYWNGSAWQEIPDCSLDAVNNFVSCSINQPGVFALFGQNYQASSIAFSTITQNATSSVAINYSIINNESEPGSLGAYEFSSTGVFNGEKRTMTPLASDAGHSGLSGLGSSPSGVSHRFVWDSVTDLSPNFQGLIYFRFTPYDALAGTGTPVIASTTLDFRAPTLGSISVATITPQSAAINWVTDEVASTQLEYGLTMNYGNTSTEKDNINRVTSHTESLSNLVSCARYYYRVRSKDVFGNEYIGSTRSLMTSGCLGGSTIKNTGQNAVSVNSGGTATLTGQLSVNLPSAYASSSVDLQLNQLDGSAALTAAPIDSSKRLVPDKIFDIKAFSDISNTISILSEAGTIEMIYADGEIANINEDTLKIYYWNTASSTWDGLNNCVRNKSLKKVTCDAPHFSVFALLGDYVATPVSSGGGGGGGGGGSSINYSLLRKPASGQFKFLLNNGASTTVSNILNLSLDGGPDASSYLISENANFAGVVPRAYSTAGTFAVSGGLGEKNVYLKFSNAYNYSSEVLSAKITLASSSAILQDNNNNTTTIISYFVADDCLDYSCTTTGTSVENVSEKIKLETIKSNLNPGNKNGEVKKMQNFLIYLELLASDANTSFYGVQTKAAVAKFQTKYKIVSPNIYGYGLFGNATRNKANALITQINKKTTVAVPPITTSPSNPATSTIKVASFKSILAPGTKNSEVRKLQDFLIARGLLVKTANNSYYGVSTRAAVAKFQIQQGIVKKSSDQGYGIFGPATLKAANKLLAK